LKVKSDPPPNLKIGDLVQRKHRPVVDADGVGWVALILAVEDEGGYTSCEFRWIDNLECGKCSAALFKVLS